MYCPNCGTGTAADTKFCRSCGMALEPVTKMLAGLDPDSIRTTREWWSNRSSMRRLGFLMFWSGLLLSAFFGILGSSLWHLADDLGRFVQSLAGLGGLAVLMGIGALIYAQFLPKKPKRPEPADYADSPGLLREPPASILTGVTDRTTALLDREEKAD